MKAKITSVWYALLSIVLLFPAGVLAQNVSFGVCTGGSSSGVGFSFCFGNGAIPGQSWMANPFGLPQGSIMGIIGGIAYWLLAILGFIGIIGFVIAGIMYLLAAGDEKQAESAKNAMKYSIYGIIVGLLGFIVIQAVTLMLNMQGSF